MKQEEIKDILLQRGYSQPGAETASADLMSIHQALQPCLEAWISNGVETDYSIDGFSIKGIMQKYGMKYPAALLSVNWILNDPQTAIPIIKRGIR